MKDYQVIGKEHPNDQAYGMVTGKLQYCSDYQGIGMLHMKLKASSITHGIIRAIRTDQAEKVEGVRAIYTCFNTPKTKYDRGRVEFWEKVPYQERLFDDHIRFRGERVAAVVADTADAAQRACDLIEVEYDELPAVISMEEAMHIDAIKLHDEGNVYPATPFDYGDYSGITAYHTHKSQSHIGRMTHLCMETQSCRAIYDSSSQKLTIWSGCQSVFGVRSSVAQFLEMHYSKVRVIKPPMGGSFGVKQETLLEPLVAYAARSLKADVKLVYTREEQIVNTMMKHSLDASIESKVDEEGKILGVTVHCDLDAGAYLTVSRGYLATIQEKMGKVYKIPNVHFEGSTICTNTPINGSFRSWGSSEIGLIFENHWNMVARELGIDPIDFRLNNILSPEDIEIGHMVSVGNVRFEDCLRKGRDRFDWDGKKETCILRNSQQHRYRYGVGMALSSHTSSFYPYRVDIASAYIRLQEDGSLVVHVAIHDHGCGTILAMKKIVSEVMEISIDKVELNEADTQVNLYDYGCYASRSVHSLGATVKECSERLLDQATGVAAAVFGCNPSFVRYSNGEFYKEMDPTNRIPLSRVVQYSIQVLGKDLFYANTKNVDRNPGVAAVHFSEVEVDTYTGMTKILSCLSVHDIGKAINPDLCRGQVGSGIQQGIGMALREEIPIHPTTGETLVTNLKNYENINSWDMPDYDVLFIEEPEASGPFSAKSIGEVVLPAVAPAIVAAVNNALDTNLTHLPLTSAVILEALEEYHHETEL